MLLQFTPALDSEDYIDSKGPDLGLRKGPDCRLSQGSQVPALGPGRIRFHGPNPLFAAGPDSSFKRKKDEENQAKKDADNTAAHCHIELVDEAVWNERQGGVCNTLMQAFCARPGRVKETAM